MMQTTNDGANNNAATQATGDNVDDVNAAADIDAATKTAR